MSIISVEGLHAIVVTDRDGVPVIKGNSIIWVPGVFVYLLKLNLRFIMFSYLVANDNAPEYALRPAFLSTFALATDQGSKLGLSKNKSIICYYNTYQVLSLLKSKYVWLKICSCSYFNICCVFPWQIVQFNRLPLVISFIASSNANTGESPHVVQKLCTLQ